MSKKIKLGQRQIKNKVKLFGSMLDVPSDAFGKCAHISLIGNREVSIDGCFGILDYSDCEVRINIGSKTLCITGSNLQISDYCSSNITVKGTFVKIEFC